MRRFGVFKVLKVIAIVLLAVTVFGAVTQHLWNWLMPSIFGLRVISFGEALGLLLLGKILFGGFHRHGGRRGFRRHMEERWAGMSPEEREKFRAGMRGRCGWPREARAAEKTAV